MPLIARRTENLLYESDDGDIKQIRQKKPVRDATSGWNTEPTGVTVANDKDRAIISKSTRRAGQRPRYFLYSSVQESGTIYTTFYLKVAVLDPANFATPPAGAASFNYGGFTYNKIKSVAEDND